MGYIVPIADIQHQARAAWRKLPAWIRAEVINEQLFILPRPTPYHAQTIGNISMALRTYAKVHGLGTLCLSDVDVYLDGHSNSVVPDVLFISKNNTETLVERKGIIGPPDLIVEVLSPSNRKHDLVTKKKLYEKAGVREYWIVDPDTKDAQGYLLKNKRYGEPLLLNSEINIRILKKIIHF